MMIKKRRIPFATPVNNVNEKSTTFTHTLPNNRVSILNPLSVEATSVAVSVVHDIKINEHKIYKP